MLKMIYKQNGILGERGAWKINDECTIIVDLSSPKYISVRMKFLSYI